MSTVVEHRGQLAMWTRGHVLVIEAKIHKTCKIEPWRSPGFGTFFPEKSTKPILFKSVIDQHLVIINPFMPSV